MPNPFQYPFGKKQPERNRTGRVYAGPEPVTPAEQAPDPDPAAQEQAGAGPEQETQQNPPKTRRTLEEVQELIRQDRISSLKRGILSMVRYRMVSVEPEELEDKTLEELQEMHDRIAEIPQTIYIDEMPIHPVTFPATTPVQMDFCPSCGSKVSLGMKFCPNCGEPLIRN